VSVQEERELRERLGGLLDGIEPRPAPVASAVRQGRGIRMRRWVTAAAGLAVIAAGAVVVPAVLHAHSAPRPAAHLHFTVTVNPPGKNAQHGLISWGSQDGHPWQIVLSGHGSNILVGGQGHDQQGGGISAVLPTPVILDGGGGGGKGSSMMLVGPVRADVTTVVLSLPEGKVLTLTPVRYGAQRIVGVVIPWGVPILRALAYHNGTELAYSIPYGQAGVDNWWLPGQVGPPRFTETIATGVARGQAWRVVAQFGPWGYCFELPQGSTCLGGLDALAPRHIDQPISCGSFYVRNDNHMSMIGLAIARADVRQVVIRLSGGSTERYLAVVAQGARLFGYLIPYHQTIRTATMYDAAGQVVGSPTDLHC
jgi:hypothetical protein